VFNNMIQDFVPGRARTLPQAHEICSFFDPYVGRNAGYLQVTRLSGAGPALLVVPEPGTKTPFEAFRPLNDTSRRGQTFEGAFEWTSHSTAYAESEWKNATPWNAPTSVTRRARAVTRARLALPRVRQHPQSREDAGRPRPTSGHRDSRLHRADGSRGEALSLARQAQGFESGRRACRRDDRDARGCREERTSAVPRAREESSRPSALHAAFPLGDEKATKDVLTKTIVSLQMALMAEDKDRAQNVVSPALSADAGTIGLDLAVAPAVSNAGGAA
jgi:Family of unknown function (DUF5695)